MRCFIAIDLPEEVKNELSLIQKRLPEAKMNLVATENLHLTLLFLGDLADFQVDQVKQSLKEIKFNKFKAYLNGLGVFPNENLIRVVWVALEPKELLRGLQNKISDKIKILGLKVDERFESHVTLSRVKPIQDTPKFLSGMHQIQVKPIQFEVQGFALKKSTLTGQGPIYEDIWRTELS